MELDALIREAAAKGLTHLTIWPVPSEDGKTIYWNARATPSTGHQYVSAANFDPVKALETVLVGLPRARRRQKEVTAAVTQAAEDQGVGLTHAEALDPDLKDFLPKP